MADWKENHALRYITYEKSEGTNFKGAAIVACGVSLDKNLSYHKMMSGRVRRMKSLSKWLYWIWRGRGDKSFKKIEESQKETQDGNDESDIRSPKLGSEENGIERVYVC